jgi:DNA-binding MarR family transcriptional regulator
MLLRIVQWSRCDRGHEMTASQTLRPVRVNKCAEMADALIQRKRDESDREIVLRLLEQVAEDEGISQARFASRIGIAKGLANAYFGKCLKRGWIKLRRAPRQRYLYYLTPKGLVEKARLTAQFLTKSYQYYRQARLELVATMREAAKGGHARLGVLGNGELAEIAAIVSYETPIMIVGFVSTTSERSQIAQQAVVNDWSELDNPEAALLTEVERTREVLEDFRSRHPGMPIYVPKHLSSLVWDLIE